MSRLLSRVRRREVWREEGATDCGRAAWDETAILFAVRGWEPYCNATRGTYRMIGSKGVNDWAPDEENGRHIRVTEKVSKAEVGRIIDELMMRKPAKGK